MEHQIRNIPFFNYPALFKEREEEYMEVIRDVLSRGAYILQSDLEELERKLEKFINVKHVYGVADGTNALILALRACGVGEGDEVIMPGHTYVATAASAHYVGASPVFVECGADHMICPEAVQKAITNKTKAIMPVQLNGRTSDMAKIKAIAEANNLLIIEDSAQALGSRFGDQYAGTFGSVGTFSFYPAKLLGCFGDGGAVVTNDPAIAEKLSLLRDHGRNAEGDVVAWGTNSRLDNMQAAILSMKLDSYEADIQRRREIAGMYQNELAAVGDLRVPPGPDADSNHYDVYQNYEIEAADRDGLKDYLEQRGVRTIIQFGGKPVHKYPLGFEETNLPFTEGLYGKLLLLPMHTALSDEDVLFVCQAIKEFYQGQD